MESPRDTTACIAAIVAMNEGALPDLDAIARKLEQQGLARERIGGVIRALSPWAASLEKDGAPSPPLATHAPIPPPPR